MFQYHESSQEGAENPTGQTRVGQRRQQAATRPYAIAIEITAMAPLPFPTQSPLLSP